MQDFQKFEKYYNEIRRKQKAFRATENFDKFLTPDRLRKHISAKKPLVLKYGDKPAGPVITYTQFRQGAVGAYIKFELPDLLHICQKLR